jgi:hypothetical protein
MFSSNGRRRSKSLIQQTGASTLKLAMPKTVLFAIPTAGHEPGDPVHDSDKDRVWLEWFDKYLK